MIELHAYIFTHIHIYIYKWTRTLKDIQKGSSLGGADTKKLFGHAARRKETTARRSAYIKGSHRPCTCKLKLPVVSHMPNRKPSSGVQLILGAKPCYAGAEETPSVAREEFNK